MSKLAKTKYGIHFLLESRWSPRAFREDAVEKDKLQRILEAAQWSPSCANNKPGGFLLVKKATIPGIRYSTALPKTTSDGPSMFLCL